MLSRTQEKIEEIKYMIMKGNPMNSRLDRNLPESYKVKISCPITRVKFNVPIRNSECYSNPECVSELEDLLNHFRALMSKSNNSSQKLLTYECLICKEINPSFRPMRKLNTLYHDKDMELALRIAEQKFFRKYEISKKNERKFKESYLQFYKNGKVQHVYQIEKDRQLVEIVIQPSLKMKDQNIYYSPSDYQFNKDGIKIVHRVMERLIMNKFKQAFQTLEAFDNSHQIIQQETNKFGKTLSSLYQKSLSIETQQYTEITLKLIKYPNYNMPLELLVYYPRHKAWNTFIVEKDPKGRFDDINLTSEVLIHREVVYIVAKQYIYEVDLRNTYLDRFRKDDSVKTIERTVYDGETGHIIKEYPKQDLKPIIVPWQIQRNTIKAKRLTLKPLVEIHYAAMVIVNQTLYWFGGIIKNKNNDQSTNLAYEMKLSSDPKWKSIAPLPYNLSEATIVHHRDSIFIIGGQSVHENKKYTHILEYSIKNNNYKTHEKHIRTPNYTCKCLVTRSIRPHQYILFDIQDSRNPINCAKIFNVQTKSIQTEYALDNFYRKHDDERNDLLSHFAFPALPAYHEGINYFITLDVTNRKDCQLVYGTDNSWFLSEPKQLLK